MLGQFFSKIFQKLSEAFTVMEFDFSKPIMPSHGKTQVLQSHLEISVNDTCGHPC